MRAITRCPMGFNFSATILLGWTPSGVLGYDSLPQKKKFRDDTTDPSDPIGQIYFHFSSISPKDEELNFRGVLGGIFEIQECFVPQKSIFDPFDKKLPARRVTVKFYCIGQRMNKSSLKYFL